MTALSSDRPSCNPNEDLFGHAPFAKSLADSIINYSSSDGLVLSLFGPWGSGKSTVLSYVKYYLSQIHESEQTIVIDFNPWWFSGQENLARAFLGQLQAVLPSKSKKFEKLGDLLGDFAEGVGGLVDLTGVTGGWAEKLGSIIGKVSKPKPKDIPALKAEITKTLFEANQRILIIIDDIDRLTPDETRQLFTVIKALANFPNVIYLLAFDREVAAKAIESHANLPGERYLEKIIQVPFEIPPVDREALRAALFKRLDLVLSGTPEGMFDQSYWTNVFYDGIDSLIKVPRDIVRFTNTLSVTYPAVVGEVNPVDFIAIEALRVFLPSVYEALRSHPEHFAGHRPVSQYSGQDDQARRAFHDSWLNKLPETQRSNVFALMQRIFPKLEQSIYGHEWVTEWRKRQRACVPEIFPIYFRLSVPEGTIRRSEILNLLTLTPNLLATALVSASKETRPDGLSKVRVLLEHLMDYVEAEIPASDIPKFINVLLDIGDQLIIENDVKGTFDFGNESRVCRILYHLLKRIDKEIHLMVLKNAISKGVGIGVQRYLLSSLSDEIIKQDKGGSEALTNSQVLDELKIAWIDQVKSLSDNGLICNSQLAKILAAWYQWGDQSEVRQWCDGVTATDEGLIAFITKFCMHNSSQTFGDWAVRINPRLNPRWLDRYTDTNTVYERLSAISISGQVPSFALESVKQYLKEYEAILKGLDPENLDDINY